MAGNIADSLVRTITQALPYVDKEVLLGCIKEVLPERGIIIEATKEELSSNPNLCNMFYREVEVVPKETFNG
jgi:hypothetical protein